MYDTDRSAGRNDSLVDRRFIRGSATYLINPYSRLKDLGVAQQRLLPLSFCIIYLSDIVIIASTTAAAHRE